MAAMSSGVLGAPPYNLAPNSIGLTFISPFIAIVPGALLAGWVCDRWTIRCARQNGGVSEPEDKLKLMIVPTILSPIGLVIMSLGVAYEAHWMVFVAGEFVLTIAGPMATLLSLTYAFDSFHSLHPAEEDGPRAEVQQAGPYVLSLILFGMCMTFGFVSRLGPSRELELTG
jgi:MFS family permease